MILLMFQIDPVIIFPGQDCNACQWLNKNARHNAWKLLLDIILANHLRDTILLEALTRLRLEI